MAEARAAGLGDRGGGGGAGAGVEEADSSPNISPGPRMASRFSRPSAAGAAELDLALADDVEPVTRVALVEQDVAALEVALGHRAHQRGGGLVVEGGEQRALFSRRLGSTADSLPWQPCGAGGWQIRPRQSVRCVPDRACRARRDPRRADAPRAQDVPRPARALPLRPLRAGLRAARCSCSSRRCCRPRPPTCGSTWSHRRCSPATRDAAALAGADRAELETMIQSTGFFRAKADAADQARRRARRAVRRRGAAAG